MNEQLNDLAAKVGIKWFDYQVEPIEAALAGLQRMCLYYKTGAGKTITGLGAMAVQGVTDVLVITPPSTYAAWEKWGQRFGLDVRCTSHAKFRMPDFKVRRDQAIIVDEFHLLGGHGGKGWKKMDRMARSLQAPMVIMSATPNYNDAERVYCIQHVLDPHSVKGGFIDFIYKHCETEQNPFGREPIVTGFHRYADAAAYLADLPQVFYLPDDLVYTINDLPVAPAVVPELDTYGYDERNRRIVASIIEERHLRVNLGLVGDNGLIRDHVYDVLTHLVGNAVTPVLIFAAHSTVADALVARLIVNEVKHEYVNGSTPTARKAEKIRQFNAGELDVLVGTASLATGTDGMDKVCNVLIILDDTDDASLRRQLIGRIMPRGEDTDASKKQVYRLLLS